MFLGGELGIICSNARHQYNTTTTRVGTFSCLVWFPSNTRFILLGLDSNVTDGSGGAAEVVSCAPLYPREQDNVKNLGS